MTNFESYQSPYSWRYGAPQIRQIWSEHYKRLLWRRCWVALAKAEAEFGLVNAKQVADLEKNQAAINMPRSLEIEQEIQHDLMAEIKVFAEQANVGGGILHLGATSMDISDNAEALRIRESAEFITGQLATLLALLSKRIKETAALPVMAFTHLQPAEPTTLGYRLAEFGQNLLEDYQTILLATRNYRGKGFKGAVGTGASFGELIGIENLDRFEEILGKELDLEFYPVATQTYPRKQEYDIISKLASLGASLYKFGFDLRILQSPSIGEIAEPFGKSQVGSSAMPFKRNPIQAEKLDSLGRLLAQMPRVAWDNAAHSLLERTLDDSANRRTILPESFLIASEMLAVAIKLIEGITFQEDQIQRNFERYGPFAATERVLMALGQAGADRQEMHERIRQHSLAAWAAIQKEQPNPIVDFLSTDEEINKHLETEKVQSLMKAEDYVGFAPQRAIEMALKIENTINSKP
jgi:adenylosuccinate lyase